MSCGGLRRPPAAVAAECLRLGDDGLGAFEAGAGVERDRAQLTHRPRVPFELVVDGVEAIGHRRSMVEGSLTLKNQMPAAIAAVATATDVASGTSGSSPTPITPQRNEETTEAIGLM